MSVAYAVHAHTYIVAPTYAHAKVRLGRSAVHSCSNLLIAFANARQREAAGVLYFISFVMNFVRGGAKVRRKRDR